MNGEGEAKFCRLGDLGRQYHHQESRLSQRRTLGYVGGGRQQGVVNVMSSSGSTSA